MILNRQRTVRIARPALESFLRRIRRHLRLGKTEVVIAFVTDAEIARLNRAYRKKKGPTDVLSFPSIQHDRPVSLPLAGSVRSARGISTSTPRAIERHPDRSEPAFSCTRALRAGSRSGGTVARSQQALSTGIAPSPRLARPSLPPGQPKFLGDIAISPATARRNAQSAGRPLTTELRILMLHGVLHLLGYDHETDSGQMDGLEQKLHQELGLA
jgi:ssRNA-specific RNase YbeY (16S rRNA maturation enzyme)